MIFEVTVLGSSSAIPTRTRFPSAQLLNMHGHLFLLDCAEGTQIQLIRKGIGLQKIEAVFISHLHGDHFFGLPGLISSMHLVGREQPLDIYGDAKLKDSVLGMLMQSHQQLGFSVNFHALKPEKGEILFESNALKIRSVLLEHGIDTWGFVFQEEYKERNISKEFVGRQKPDIDQIKAIKQGADYYSPNGQFFKNADITFDPPEPRTYAYCSDTSYFKALPDQIKPATTLYHEASYLEADHQLAVARNHSTAGQAAKIARDAGCKKLIIGHFSARYKDDQQIIAEAARLFENTYLAEDLTTFEVI